MNADPEGKGTLSAVLCRRRLLCWQRRQGTGAALLRGRRRPSDPNPRKSTSIPLKRSVAGGGGAILFVLIATSFARWPPFSSSSSSPPRRSTPKTHFARLRYRKPTENGHLASGAATTHVSYFRSRHNRVSVTKPIYPKWLFVLYKSPHTQSACLKSSHLSFGARGWVGEWERLKLLSEAPKFYGELMSRVFWAL